MSQRSRTIALPLLLIVALILGAPGPWDWRLMAQAASAPVAAPFAGTQVPEVGAFAPGQVLVRWREGVSDARLALSLQAAGWPVLHTLDSLRLAVVQTPQGGELEAIARLENNPLVAQAEPDYLVFALGAPAAGVDGGADRNALLQLDDPLWVEQWAARRVQAAAAWEVSAGDPAVIVAVVDSGVDLTHPEFAGRLLPGYDYVNNDSRPQDDFGHGTHIAGVIAAAGDNGAGVAGMAWKVRLLPLKVLDHTGAGTASNVALAVLNAFNQGASVINLSLALSADSPSLHSAIQIAHAGGAVIVGAVGNDTVPGQLPAAVRYPAAYPEVLAISATTHGDDWASYSNGGPEVDLAAPGGQGWDGIISTYRDGGYAWLHGSSIAAPHVTGVVALMRSVAPLASNDAIAGSLRNTADKVGSYPYPDGRNDRLGHGRLNAGKALRQMLPPQLALTPDSLELLTQVGQPARVGQATLQNPSGQPLTWQITQLSQDWLDVDSPWSGTLTYPQSRQLNIRTTAQSLPIGLHSAQIRIKTTDTGGNQRNYSLPVRLLVAPQVWNTFLPAVDSNRFIVGWVDASQGGIALRLTDDDAQAVELPFQFPFYGAFYNEVWVHANGFLSFGRPYAGGEYAVNHCVPSLSAPDGAIYVLWDDLDPSQGGGFYFRNVDGQYFVAEWRDVPRWDSDGVNTFQAILWPDGQIVLHYKAVAEPNSVTVGTENWDNTLGQQIACNGNGSPPAAGQLWRFSATLP